MRELILRRSGGAKKDRLSESERDPDRTDESRQHFKIAKKGVSCPVGHLQSDYHAQFNTTINVNYRMILVRVLILCIPRNAR